MKLLKQLLSLIWECQHSDYTFPQTDPKTGETHVCCLSCGREFPYSLEHWRRIA